MPNGKDDASRPAEVDLDHGVRRVARGSPPLRRLPPPECSDDGVDDMVVRIRIGFQLGAGDASLLWTAGIAQIGDAYHPAARRAVSQMRAAGRLRAHRTLDRLANAVRALIDVTDRTMVTADVLPGTIAEEHDVVIAVEAAVLEARMRMSAAHVSLARAARRHFIRRERGAWLEGTLIAVRLADQAARCVGTTQMGGAVDALIDGAGRAVFLANILLATRTAGHLVDPDALAGSALAEAKAFAA